MNYEKSSVLLDKIRSANKIVINCHKSPDPDCVGSALSLKRVIEENFQKHVDVICPDDVPEETKFLSGAQTVKTVLFSQVNFNDYDLFLIVDTSNWDRVDETREFKHPGIFTFVIDNHKSNNGFGDENLLDFQSSSVCEMLFNIFDDWNVEIDIEIATCIYAGILGDTGIFQYEIYKNTFDIASKLVLSGVNYEEVIFHLFKTKPLSLLKHWGQILLAMNIDDVHHFVWSALDLETIKKNGFTPGITKSASTHFAPIVDGTDFGIIMLQSPEGDLNVSMRSRTDFDVSQIAVELGGGGHAAAAGTTIKGLFFNDAVEKVLTVARKYAKQ